MDHQQLDDAWHDIQARVQADGLAVFPMALDQADVEWPDDDWSAFLDVAREIGCRLIYLDHHEMNKEDLDELERSADADDEPDMELAASIRVARVHLGKACRIEVAFPYGVVIRRWMAESAWLADLDEGTSGGYRKSDLDRDGFVGSDWRAKREASRAAREAESERLEPQVARWVTLLSNHPEYLAAPSQEVRRTVACELLPELDGWLNQVAEGGVESAQRHAAWDVSSRADYTQKQVKAQRMTDAKAAADEWADELSAEPDFKAASTVDERRRLATEFVSRRLEFPSAGCARSAYDGPQGAGQQVNGPLSCP